MHLFVFRWINKYQDNLSNSLSVPHQFEILLLLQTSFYLSIPLKSIICITDLFVYFLQLYNTVLITVAS